MLINLPGTTAAEDSDEDAEHVTGNDGSSEDDELRLGCVFGFGFGGGISLTSDVPAVNQQNGRLDRHSEYLPAYQR